MNFAWIHAFPFSARPGTLAFSMTPKIPERTKNERVKWLAEIAVSGKISYINSFKEKTVEATVEKKFCRNQMEKIFFMLLPKIFFMLNLSLKKIKSRKRCNAENNFRA